MVSMDTKADAQLAVEAAQAGAAVVRDMYGTSLPRTEKPGGDFATAADLAAEEAVLDVLRTARPADAVTAEESGHTGPGGAPRPTVTAAAPADPFSGEVFWTDGERARARARKDGVDEEPARR